MWMSPYFSVASFSYFSAPYLSICSSQNLFSASFFADLMAGWGRHLTQLPIDVPYLALKVSREKAKQTLSLNAEIVLWIQNYIFGIQIWFRRGISIRSGWAIISGQIGFESVIFVSKKFQFWIRMSINFRWDSWMLFLLFPRHVTCAVSGGGRPGGGSGPRDHHVRGTGGFASKVINIPIQILGEDNPDGGHKSGYVVSFS